MFQRRRRKERRPISLSGLFSVFFFWGGGVWASGSSLWASDFRYSLAHCLVSKKVSVEHCGNNNNNNDNNDRLFNLFAA